jgi:hypothetical protein
MSGFNMESFAPYESDGFGNASSDFEMNRLLPSVRKDDFVSNFWKGIPNLDSVEKDLTDIDRELAQFTKNKEIISEYDFLISLKRKVNTTLNSLKDLIKERQKGRKEIENSADSLRDQIFFFKTNGALLTSDQKDIEFNRKWKTDLGQFEDKLMEYRRYIISKTDIEIAKINYVLQKYEELYNKLISIMTKINEEIYQVHFKDKMPKSNIFCTICLTNTSTHACVPCGHIFCKGCITSIKEKCASCRKKIESTIKLFNLEEIDANTGAVIENTNVGSTETSIMDLVNA